MTAWRYKAIDGKGRAFDGQMDAADEAAVLARIRRDGAMPLSITLGRRDLFGGILTSSGRRDVLTRRAVTDMTRELATMLAAGQDIDRALRFLVETAPGRRMLSPGRWRHFPASPTRHALRLSLAGLV